MKVRFLRLGYFVWVLALAAGVLAYLAWGLPHAIWSYSYYGGERGDFASRHYVRCTFVGPYGVFTLGPSTGRCLRL